MKLNVPKRCLCSKWSGMQGYKYLGEGGGGLIIKLITTRTSYTIKYCDVLKFEALFSSAYNSQN